MNLTKAQKRYLLNEIRARLEPVDPARYSQEPQLQGAVLGKLDGFSYNGRTEKIFIRYTGVDDHGPGAAEKKYGADFAITISRYPKDGERVDKATLGQSKRGKVSDLRKSENERLLEQTSKMGEYTNNPLVLELPTERGIDSNVRITNGDSLGTPIEIGEYLVEQLIACTHGDVRKEFVAAVQESSLSKLEVFSFTKDNSDTKNGVKLG